MNKEEVIKALKVIYNKALNANDIPLCLKILQEIIVVNQMREYTYEID